MLGKRFLDHLEERGLLDESIIKNLRQQLAERGNKVRPEMIADRLVIKGHLTKYQAKKLVAEVSTAAEQEKEEKAQAKEKAVETHNPSTDELLLVDGDEEIVAMEAVDEEEADAQLAEGLTPLDNDAELTPLPSNEPELIPETAAISHDPLGVGGIANDPLADPLGLESEVASAPTGYAATTETPAAPKQNKWGSKLFIGGLGGLLLLILTLVTLMWVLNTGSGDELFGEAEADYDQGSYSNAIKKYTAYLEDYSGHVDVSKAKVHMNFARIRVAAQGKAIPTEGLDAAEKLLLEVKEEEAFGNYRSELATLLTQDMAQKFATAAKVAADIDEKRRLLEFGDRSMKLVDNPEYVTTSDKGKVGANLRKIQEDFAEVRRDIERDKTLEETQRQISDALANSDTIKAFQYRAELLDKYPSLESDERIQKTTANIAERESDLVEVVEDPLEPTTVDDQENSVILASNEGDEVPGVRDDDILPVQASGTVYGLQAKTGRVLWQRKVGQDHSFLPTGISTEPGADTVFVDSRSNALVRVRSQDGNLIWRVQIDEPFYPIFRNKRVVVATESGKLMEVNLDTGQIDRHAKLPQTLRVGPAFDATRPVVFQVGEHSTIYIVDANTLECNEVYYLGHQKGAVSTAPTLAVGMLFIVDNYRKDECRIHVLRSTPDGKEPKQAMDPIRIKGNIVAPPIVDRRRILFVSDIRGIHLFEVEPSADPPVQSVVAGVPTSNNKRVHSIPLIYETSLFVADDRLAKYELRETTSELLLQWAVNQNDTFQGSLNRVGASIVSQRQRQDGGVTVTAADLNDGQKIIWTTKLGQAAAQTSPSFQDSSLAVISSSGDLFSIAKQQFESGAVVEPIQRVEAKVPYVFSQALNLSERRVALIDTIQGQAAVYDLANTTTPPQLISFRDAQNPHENVQTSIFADALLVPRDSGAISLLNVLNGAIHAYGFQPSLGPGETIKWTKPVLVKNGRQFVIGNNRNQLFRILLKTGKEKYLTQARTAELDELADELDILRSGSPLHHQLTALDDHLFLVMRGDAGDVVLHLDVNKLKPTPNVKPVPLKGRVTWGPATIGKSVLLVTDGETKNLVCLQSDGKLLWESPLNHGPLVGPVLADGSDFLLTSVRGIVWRVRGDSGEEVGQIRVAESLASARLCDGQLLLSGSSGSLYLKEMP